ncbi:hypothetical protein [Pusillimonas sp. NJUB218]|uniref:hypothetical protein n=1 Tax=Pusillimonas sp. NJUB218 TaxID=2023230 RepID=UPI000F4C05D3|nr:hypothetical protein [Pusillimonas sp. NJUB218]ROT46091.1 hypothetical protein CHR62_03695 [Pusillimonas sp. NJUB218]
MKTYTTLRKAIVSMLSATIALLAPLSIYAQQAAPYTISKDETMGSIKRTVEATLPAKVDEKTLGQLAVKIRDSNKNKFGLTFIGWRVDGEKADTYWANTRFDPEMNISIIGTPAGN